MATEKQIAANRANAKRSTGPKTEDGRRASSRNALRHGMCRDLPVDESNPTKVDNLVRALTPQEAPGDQIAAARQIALIQLELSRIRSFRTTWIASLDPDRCDIEELRRLLVLDRYERIARAKRRKAAGKLWSVREALVLQRTFALLESDWLRSV
jgi:hypothetical protein